MAALTPAPLEGSLNLGGRDSRRAIPSADHPSGGAPSPSCWIALTCNRPKIPLPLGAGRGRQVTASPPGQKRVPGAAEQSACVFSDNSVVGHTRINRVVKDGPRGTRFQILSLLGPFFSGLVEFTHTRVIPRLAQAGPQVTRG